MEVGDPLFKVLNDPIFVNWYGDKSFPLLAIGTETMGGFENGLPVYDKNKSDKLFEIYNNEIKKLGLPRIDRMPQLRENLAVCNVVRNVNSNIPLNVTRDDYKDDETFGDAGGQGEEPATEVYKKIVNNAKWVLSKLLEGKNVYIHCHAGASRSPTVVAKVIMDFLNVSLDDAIKLMKINAPKDPNGHDRIEIGKFKNLLENVPGTSDSSEKVLFLKRLSEKRKTLDFLTKEGLSTTVIEKEIEEIEEKLRDIEGQGREPEPATASRESNVSYDEQGQPINPKKAVFFDIDHTLMTASRDQHPGVKLEDLERGTIEVNEGLKLITHSYLTDQVGSITQFTTDKIIDMLRNLNKKNVDIYIVSNGNNVVPFEQILKKAGLVKNIIKNFDGGWNITKVNALGKKDDGGAKKDEIARIIKENNYLPENVVFVDDDVPIINTVASLGIKTLRVTDIVNQTLNLNIMEGEFLASVDPSKLLREGNISTLYEKLGIPNQGGGRRKKTRNKSTKKGGGNKKRSRERRK